MAQFCRNFVGPQVKKLREEMFWTQEQLADACKGSGYKISRGTIAKIEAQLCGVDEIQLFVLINVLKTNFRNLFPKNPEELLSAGKFKENIPRTPIKRIYHRPIRKPHLRVRGLHSLEEL